MSHKNNGLWKCGTGRTLVGATFKEGPYKSQKHSKAKSDEVHALSLETAFFSSFSVNERLPLFSQRETTILVHVAGMEVSLCWFPKHLVMLFPESRGRRFLQNISNH
jgi:hypothetical protein